MQTKIYKEISLSKISSNPNNPRKNFSGPQFDELVESIRQKGVIEPIVIRPKSNKNSDYEVVAGDRRFKAACLVSRNQHIQSRIPAIIRDLSDEEAFDFMVIENLQREDLTPFEEAQGFRQYFEKKGKGSIPELAARIGKSAGYIRRKIAALSLPDYILKAWEKDELQFSHLEQLRRLKNKEELKEAFEVASNTRYGRKPGSPISKRELKEYIESNMAPPLNNALFNIKEQGCITCGQNSDVQKDLWNIEGMKGAHCLDTACFREKQINFLTENWKNSQYRRRYGTNGFRVRDEISWDDYKSFDNWGPQPAPKCKNCENFITIIHLEGKVDEGKACVGNQSCYNAIGRQERKEKIERGDEPRVTWHGEYFREEFFKKLLPKKIKEVEASDLKIAQLALFAFAKLNWRLYRWFAKKNGIKDNYRLYEDDALVFNRVAKMGLEEIQEYMKTLSIKVLMSEADPKARRAAAAHFGIDLAKEWFVTKEYLEKKTIKEILEFGEKSKIFKDKKVQDYLVNNLKKKPGKFDKCKKTELIDLLLKSGVALVGKVPDEILKADKK